MSYRDIYWHCQSAMRLIGQYTVCTVYYVKDHIGKHRTTWFNNVDQVKAVTMLCVTIDQYHLVDRTTVRERINGTGVLPLSHIYLLTWLKMNKSVLLTALSVLVVYLVQQSEAGSVLEGICEKCEYCKTDPGCSGCEQCESCRTDPSQVSSSSIQRESKFRVEVIRSSSRAWFGWQLIGWSD